VTIVRLAAVSDYLLDLYARSAVAAPANYACFALDGFRDLMGATKAWWGIMSNTKNGPRLLSSFRSNLPISWDAVWETVKQDDNLAQNLMRTQNRTFTLDSATIPPNSGLMQLADGFDIRETVVSSVRVPEQDAFMFVSLYRSSAQRRFTPEDKAINQLLIPHLYAAWSQNLGERLRSPTDDSLAYRAFVDQEGRLVRHDDGFVAFIARRWRSWRGAHLPPLLRESIRRSNNSVGEWIGQDGWSVRAKPAGLLTFVELRVASALECLTPRERQVVEIFADGATHKEISLAIGLTPSTVRYYIREAYSKLGIDNKAVLAALISREGRALS
jgi:DNA-binding CsgD family transcriptional regulator